MTLLLISIPILLIALFSLLFWRFLCHLTLSNSLSIIPGPPRRSWWKGNYYQIFDVHGWQFHHDIVRKYGNIVRLSGLFGADLLYVCDPLALHHIVVKDQHVYEETLEFIATNAVIFGSNLASTMGEQHRRQRKMLNPVFSMKHMRGLNSILYPITYQLRDVLARQVERGEEEINVMKWMSRAALEYIGQGGLGYSFDALDEGATNTYSDAVKMLPSIAFNLKLTRQILPYIINIGNSAFRRRLVEWMPSKAIQEARRIVDMMDSTSRAIYAQKKEALARGDEEVVKQVGRGKDIMSVLLRANMAAEVEDKLPEEELIGQMSSFIFAGQDTTTSALCRILHLLSLHSDMQNKLREEVTKARKEYGDMDYDTLMALPYLDAVCRETLRVYPPSPFRVRTTRKDTILPLQSPVKSVDGKTEISEILVKKNTDVIVSIIGANLSKAIWGEDAEEWKPERWLMPLPGSVAASHLPGIYSSMMTFIGGGRACIGFKFAELEMKLVLSILLESFVFSPTKDIYWNMGRLQSPVLKDSKDTSPQLPLRISLVQE